VSYLKGVLTLTGMVIPLFRITTYNNFLNYMTGLNMPSFSAILNLFCHQHIKKHSIQYLPAKMKIFMTFSGFLLLIEIFIKDEIKIQVEKGFDPDLLNQVIRVLEQLPC